MNNLSTVANRARNPGVPSSVSILVLALIGAVCGSAPAAAAPLLGSDLASFTVLGASTVTNVTTSTIVGNVGVWSSGGANAITGFNSAPGVAVADTQVTGGTVQAGTTTAMAGQLQLVTAISNLGLLGPGTVESADLTGLTLAPGVYTVAAGTTNLSGTLTLDGGQCQRGLGFPDAEHTDHFAQLGREGDQYRVGCRRVLECWQLRNHRYKHDIHGQYSRAHQHHHELHRNRSLW
jgi:hypothetical protein